MKLMKTLIVVCVLVMTAYSIAGLRCRQLVGCAGSLGCFEGGSADGCEIECTGGGTVECLEKKDGVKIEFDVINN